MSVPFIGEVRMFGGTFAPSGWSFCDGNLLSIQQNQALWSLIGKTYGGDGVENFALPNLQGCIPIGQGQGAGLTDRTLGEQVGTESVTLTEQQMPGHTHFAVASMNTGSVASPTNQVLGTGTSVRLFRAISPSVPLASNVVGLTGGTQPHDNTMPYLTINYIIALTGIYPPPS